jgi:hypothetical protein
MNKKYHMCDTDLVDNDSSYSTIKIILERHVVH